MIEPRAPGVGRVGFIGLGKMGGPMCRRLLSEGVQVVGHDSGPGVTDALIDEPGFLAASSPAEVADQVTVLILMLPHSDAVEAVVIDRLLGKLAEGTIVIDMSSSVPARTRALSTRLADVGAVLVDAPVSGGVRGAVEGTLTVMVGGPAEAAEAVRPLLEILGRRVEYVGDVGAGHAVKALNNLMSAAHLWVTSEALLAARRFGLDVPTALRVINGSSGRSGSTENKWPNFILPGSYDSGFMLSLMSKDVKIALDLIEGVGVRSTMSQAVADLWAEADAGLPAGSDHTEIVKWLERTSAPGGRQDASMAP